MATSGSFSTSQYNNRGLVFSWSRKSYSTSGNYSDISWSLKGNGSHSGYYMAGAFKVVINGDTVYSSSTRIQLYEGTTVASGTKRIYHNNDGTKTFSASAEAGIYTYAVNCSGSGKFTLNTIPRYAVIKTLNITPIDETSVQYSYTVDSGINWAWYSTDNGSTWSNLPNSNVVSGLTAGTSYNFKLRVRRSDSGLTTDSSTYVVSTYDYPKPSSVNDFVIGEGATVNLYNPLGREVTLDLISNNDNSVIGTYTGTYAGDVNAEFKTAEAIDKQYKSIPNSNTGTYYARVTYGQIVKTLGTGTYSTNISECSPTFSNFSVQDSNANIVAVTGSNQVYVKGYSILKAIITSANKMTTQKYATPSSYTISCDTLNQNVAYSNNNIELNIGTLVSSGTLRVNARAYDSRTNSVVAYKDITVYDYNKPVVNVSATRLNKFENETTVSINGTYNKLTIDNTNKNTITNVKYRYRETGGSWSNWTNVNTTVNNGNFTCSDVILSLDNTKAFDFEIQVTDRIDYTTTTANIDVGQAIFFISSNNRTCYLNGEDIRLLAYPVGSIYISVDNTNPTTLFGGTWEQIKDTFLLSAGDTYTAGSTGGEATHQLTANEMPIEGMIGVDCGDTGAKWCIGEIKNYSAGTYKIARENITIGSHNNMPPYLTVYVWKRTA